jgi:hypothetical protein
VKYLIFTGSCAICCKWPLDQRNADALIGQPLRCCVALFQQVAAAQHHDNVFTYETSGLGGNLGPDHLIMPSNKACAPRADRLVRVNYDCDVWIFTTEPIERYDNLACSSAVPNQSIRSFRDIEHQHAGRTRGHTLGRKHGLCSGRQRR